MTNLLATIAGHIASVLGRPQALPWCNGSIRIAVRLSWGQPKA
jgi:hypothetical protein